MEKCDISRATVFREYGNVKKITGALNEGAQKVVAKKIKTLYT
jgi:hypothetical protein